MAHTNDDLYRLERAQIALATGSRKEAITLSSGLRIDFTPVTLPQLQELINIVRSELNAASGAPSFWLGQTSKGVA